MTTTTIVDDNGGIKLVISPDNDIDKITLQKLSSGKVESVTGENISIMGKPISGSIIITDKAD